MTFEPGIYKATVRGVPGVTVLIDQTGMGHHDAVPSGARHTVFGDNLADARPLIVLDPESDQVREFLERKSGLPLLDLIESQIAPSRIPEPGLWGVVKAAYNAGGYLYPPLEWVQVEDGSWMSRSGTCDNWHSLIDPVLIREGLS